MPRWPRSQADKEHDLALGQRLAALRRQRGVTQVELATQIGKLQSLVSAYELGKLRPHPAMIVRLAQALHISTDELLGVQPAAPPHPFLNRRALRRLQAIDRLPKRDQDALFRTIDAFLRARKPPGDPRGPAELEPPDDRDSKTPAKARTR